MECLLQSLKAIGLVLFYYFFSITLTFYNKWILMVTRLPGSQRSSNNRPTSLSSSPGVPVSPLYHHDSPGDKVHTGLAGQKGYILLHQTASSRAWMEGLLKKYCSRWYAPRLVVELKVSCVISYQVMHRCYMWFISDIYVLLRTHWLPKKREWECTMALGATTCNTTIMQILLGKIGPNKLGILISVRKLSVIGVL